MNRSNAEMATYVLEQGYFYIQTCDDGYDYTVYDLEFKEFDGGQLDNPELSIEKAAQELMKEYFPNSTYKSMPYEIFLEIIEEL